MGKINSRAKGASGERELIGELKKLLPPELTDGLERNLEQVRGGGHDINGLPGWTLEVKRYSEVKPADMERFWLQTTEQARNDHGRPALAYRQDRRDWRVVIRMEDMCDWVSAGDDYDYTCELSLRAFALLVKASHVS